MAQRIDYGLFEVVINVDKAVKDLDNFKDKLTSEQLFDDIGKAGVKIIQDLLEPLKRSGKTSDSFTYKKEGMSVIIYSDNSAAYYINTGFSEAPSSQALMEWMNYKPEFSGLSASEAERVAFAIRKSIEDGKKPGPASTLSDLQPVGERKFDYVKLAVQQLKDKVDEQLSAYLRTL